VGAAAIFRLVVLNLGAAGFVTADCAQAEAHLLLFHVDLDDLEVVLKTGFELGRAAGLIAGLGDVAKSSTPSAISTKRAELRCAQHLAVNDVAHAMRGEEALPNVGLQLLDAQAQAAVLRLNAETTALTFSPFFTISEGCLTRLVQERLDT